VGKRIQVETKGQGNEDTRVDGAENLSECYECLKKKWVDELRSGTITREEFNRRMEEMRKRSSTPGAL